MVYQVLLSNQNFENSVLLAEKILNASACFNENSRVTYCNSLSSALVPVNKIYSK